MAPSIPDLSSYCLQSSGKNISSPEAPRAGGDSAHKIVQLKLFAFTPCPCKAQATPASIDPLTPMSDQEKYNSPHNNAYLSPHNI